MSCKQLILVIFPSILFITACAPSRYVAPLPVNTYNVTVSGGGALFDFQDNTIPFPLSSVVLGYGVNESLTVWGSVQPTAAIYGVFYTELGAVKKLYQGDKIIPSLSIAPSAHFMVDKWQGNKRFYPAVDVNLYWQDLFTHDLFYVGVNNWFDLSQVSSGNTDQQRYWINSLQAGYRYQPNKMQYTLELKYIAPTINNEDIVVDFTGVNNKGALGVYFSVGKTF